MDESNNNHVVPSKTVVVNSRQLTPYLKEFDFDVFGILHATLVTQDQTDSSVNVSSSSGDTQLLLQPAQLSFLLDDLNMKLEHVLISGPSNGRGRNPFQKTNSESNWSIYHNLNELGVQSVVQKSVALLPSLCRHIEATSEFFQAITAGDDGIIDGPGSSTPQFTLMGDCFNRLLQALLSLFSWTGFTLPDNRAHLTSALLSLVSRLASGSCSQINYIDAVKQAFNYVKQLSASIPSLPVAVTQCRLLACLAAKIESDQLKFETGELCTSYLKRNWMAGDGQKEKGKQSSHNEQLQILLQICFAHSKQVEATLLSLAAEAMQELLNDDDNDTVSTTYPTLSKRTYPVFYRVVLQELVDFAKTLLPGKSSEPVQERVKRLTRWTQAINVFNTLIKLTKAFDARLNLGSALKYGRLFVEHFLRNCMPLLDDMFRGHKDEVLGLLKTLQLTTRALHHVCGHSKIMKDVSLTNQVPQLKRSLEVFVYRVKAMLTVNNCLEAFWLGNLKNRNLKVRLDIQERSTVGADQLLDPSPYRKHVIGKIIPYDKRFEGEEIVSQVSRLDDSSIASNDDDSRDSMEVDNDDTNDDDSNSAPSVRHNKISRKPLKIVASNPRAGGRRTDVGTDEEESIMEQSCSEIF